MVWNVLSRRLLWLELRLDGQTTIVIKTGGEKSWLRVKMQGKCWSQRESRLDSCWRWNSWSCHVWGWRNLQVQSADVVLSHVMWIIEFNPKKQQQNKADHPKNPQKKSATKILASNTLFLQELKSQPFYKNINSAFLTWLQQHTHQITNYADLLLETTFSLFLFPVTVVFF